MQPRPATNPPQLRALYEGKTLFAPVPYLTHDCPYLGIDPAKIAAKGISFEDVDTFVFASPGSVAVSRSGGRRGKRAGFADLETGIFREPGKIGPKTVLASTARSCQSVPEARAVMMPHDSALDYVATEAELIVTGITDSRPAGVDWDHVRENRYDTILFLHELRTRIEAR